MFSKFKIPKLNNAGVSLIELVVVISIMTALTGTAALGINLAFSRDANKCATKLNDAIYTARMESMSKVGAYYLEVKKEGNDFVAIINDGTSEVYNEKISENGKISQITYALNGPAVGIDGATTAKIVFDKSKGNVKEFNGVGFTSDGASGTNVDGLIVFTIDQRTGNRSDTVTVVTSTGKHKIGN